MKKLIAVFVLFSFLIIIAIALIFIFSDGKSELKACLENAKEKPLLSSVLYSPPEGVQPSEPTRVEGVSVTLTAEELGEMEKRERENPRHPYELAFVSGSFTPEREIDPQILKLPKEKEFTYGFIMILGLHTEEKYKQLECFGVKTLGYFTHHSTLAKIPLKNVKDITKLEFVYWIGYAKQWQKLGVREEDMSRFINEGDREVEVFVHLFEKDDANSPDSVGTLGRILQNEGMAISNYNDAYNNHYYYGKADLKTLKKIVEYDFVHAVEVTSAGNIVL